MTTKNLIKRNDYDRVLITETLPYETPIFFSNDGLYKRLKQHASASAFLKKLTEELVWGRGVVGNRTQPYHYKIRKNSLEYRRLALLHPASQWKIKEFYEKNEKIIIHFCSNSNATIRAPKGIASSFYSKSSWENIHKYKTGSILEEPQDGYAKHMPSFFSYKGHDRLYKFFASPDYYGLEKNFSTQLTLDVAKCFDSIYTHSIAWATKDKEFAKTSGAASTFGDDFDACIRHGNYGETNGIPIGPEVSRIFSEIIFQRIDQSAQNKLDLRIDIDYAIRRYVDDVYIFSNSPENAQKIYKAYADALTEFNLHTNSAKSTLLQRPFISKKSKIILLANQEINRLTATIFGDEDSNAQIPKRMYKPWSVSKKFIDAIKTLCANDSASYDDVASFLISALTERVKRMISMELATFDADEQKNYFDAIRILIEIQFFLYSVAPSVSASYKVSTSIILVIRFSRRALPIHDDELTHKLYELVLDLLTQEARREKHGLATGFVHLECLNILLAAKELGPGFLIPAQVIEDLFMNAEELGYFTIAACLFYTRNEPEYGEINKVLLKYIKVQLSNISHIFQSSEKAHLFLDMIGCPYLPKRVRSKWIAAMNKHLDLPPIDAVSLSRLVDDVANQYWHINWADIDLLNSLEKKELKRAY